jgi:hypothetical protein
MSNLHLVTKAVVILLKLETHLTAVADFRICPRPCFRHEAGGRKGQAQHEAIMSVVLYKLMSVCKGHAEYLGRSWSMREAISSDLCKLLLSWPPRSVESL